MPVTAPTELQARLVALVSGAGPEAVTRCVDAVLHAAVQRSASDVHFEPTHRAVDINFRLDGVLQRVASLPREMGPGLVARLKVLAELLTYRLDVPQEGRLVDAARLFGVDMRVSTFPTVHGEKAAVRLFEQGERVFDLQQLGLPDDVFRVLQKLLRRRSGALLLTGPSGSGKTTTIYACLRYLVGSGRHIVTIEDPVEQVLKGVSQAQARPGTEFDFARGLRSLLRQDPEVIMIGEVRDPETAGIAIEAALTGHLVFSTLHAGSSCGVVGRLLDMGVEPYLLTSGVEAILNQRLVRRLCPICRRHEDGRWQAVGCEACAATGYRGRLLLAELLAMTADLRRVILIRPDTTALEEAAGQELNLRQVARSRVEAGDTTQEEIDRVLGPE